MKILYNFFIYYNSIYGVVIKIGLHCNFFLSENLRHAKQTSLFCRLLLLAADIGGVSEA